MAQLDIHRIRKIEKFRNTIHGRVSATYTVFTKGENKYFQIDTFGNDGREIPGKTSQSLQFDREAAHFLVVELTKEFDL